MTLKISTLSLGKSRYSLYSSCSQTVSLSPAISSQFNRAQKKMMEFRRSSFLKCALQPNITKINKKTPYFGSSGSFKVIYVDTTERLVTSACCDRQHAMPICNHFSRKLANNGKKQLLRGYHSLMPSCQVSLNLENRDLDRQNQRSMLKISYAAC